MSLWPSVGWQHLHASWSIDAPGPRNDSYNIGYNPQFGLVVTVPSHINRRAGATAAVWLVLSRHVTRTEVTSEARDRCVGEELARWWLLARRCPVRQGFKVAHVSFTPVLRGCGCAYYRAFCCAYGREGRIGAGATEGDPNMDYLALHVYENKGSAEDGPPRRRFYPRDPLVRGVYSNNPHSLVRFDAKPGRHSYTLVVSQYKRLRTIDFSIHAYSMAPARLSVAANPFKEVFVAGAWTSGTSGGNPRHAGFFENPQYSVTLAAAGDVMLRLEAPVTFASQVRMVASGGERVVDSKGLSAEVRAASCPYAATPGVWRDGALMRHNFACCSNDRCARPATTATASRAAKRQASGLARA